MLVRVLFWQPIAFFLAIGHSAPNGQGFGSSSDLTNFVTRPEIKAPLFNVTIYDGQSLEDGHWFIGPYGNLLQPNPHPSVYHPCHTGPHIYDQAGDLVWSGACDFKNRVTCDFRAFRANQTSFLSGILIHAPDNAKGKGIILNSSYSIVQHLHAGPGITTFDMHELTFVDQGSRALYLVSRPRFVGMSGYFDGSTSDSGYIVDSGICEVDIASGSTTFVWWASDHIALSESSAVFLASTTRNMGWDWLHPNSVNKNDDGDYIISARYTNAIYKISGKDGSILWRLGGTRSTFALEGFNFSRQHDAQWIHYNDDEELITFLDNGADNSGYSTSTTSSVLVVRLDKSNSKAIVEQRIWRPDGGSTQLRGNLQLLPNGNKLISWSDNSYITEHAADGRLLMQAHFQSARSVNYRAYKYPFEGLPTERPVVHATTYRAGGSSMTIYFVSWNGATSVAKWRFWRVIDSDDDSPIIGETPRTGFETSYQSEGCERQIYAEALRADCTSLGRTEVIDVKQPHPAGQDGGFGTVTDPQKTGAWVGRDEL